MPLNPTPEQAIAIETLDRPLLVEAGAGTGKTWVLVQRFMYLLEQHPEWPIDSIVAVTFTEKATREMRSRIRRAVENAAIEAHSDSPWHDRRQELERLQISTIHGLCARILRENAFAAGVDPFFDVLDEQEADLLKEEAIRQTLAELVEEDSPVLELLAILHVRDLRSEMESLLDKRGTVQHLFEQLPEEKALLDLWRQGLEEMRQALWQTLMLGGPELKWALDDVPGVMIRDPDDKLAHSVRLAQDGCQMLAAGDLPGAVAYWLDIKLGGGRQANWGGKESIDELKTMLRTLRDAAKSLDNAGATGSIGPDDEVAAQYLHRWQQLWDRLAFTYDGIKDERQALDFDDLERLAVRLLELDPKSERLRDYLDGINHLMVDEFQDTNETQQRIVYTLAHPADGGRLFVVGDAKQSIYRFRQAQVAIFNRTASDIQSITGEAPIALSRSFRTHAALVDAFNDLFDQLLLPLGGVYMDYEAHPGPLEAHRATPPSSSTNPVPAELLLIPNKDEQDEKVNAEAGRIWEARLLARRFHEMQAEGFLVWDKEEEIYRPFHYGDAAILFRATTSLPLYETEFKTAGLPYLTVSGRGYYDRPEVRDLIALLACLYAPGDDLSLATALRSPLFNLSDETLYRLRWHLPNGERASDPIPFNQALPDPPATDQNAQVIFAGRVMEKLWDLAGRVDVWQLLRTAIDETGYEAALILGDRLLDGTGRQHSNVQKFLALARERGGASLSDFLRRLQDLQAREAREGEALGNAPEAGAVQLMSIHAAKGLEFSVVVVADLGRTKRGGFGSPRILHDPAFGLVCMQRDEIGEWQKPASYRWAEWLDGRMEAAESKRLLYVACTRAADLLILSGQKGGRGSWMSELLALWDIDPEGGEEEVVPAGSYSLKVFRPKQEPAVQVAPSAPIRDGADVLEMTPLAEPLSENMPPPPISVTRLLEQMAQKVDELPKVRPAVYGPSSGRQPLRAPRWLVGRIVHQALADWRCLDMPPAKLDEYLDHNARREGNFAEEMIRQAVSKSRLMLEELQNSNLFAEIDRAFDGRNFFSEVPFSMGTNFGTLYGKIDLLFQDEQGVWKLIEWKTERVPASEKYAQAKEHMDQVALYSLAAEEVLGVPPKASICFLNPGLQVYSYWPDELSSSIKALETA